MKIPTRLQPLLDAHIIDDVVGQLQSGKEAEVYVVRCGDTLRCAKVYKGEHNRSFKQKTQYTEGRKVRGSRRGRAMESNSRYGRQERENEWQNTEVDALALLAASGVHVPKTYAYYEGVLVLHMIVDKDGNPAPRLNDVDLTAEQARSYHQLIIRQAVLMLCAGIVHGDLSEFNILLSADGPVIIDLPQAVMATANNAFGIFERDLIQLAAFFGRFASDIKTTAFPKEIWKLYENGALKPDSPLTGLFEEQNRPADIRSVMSEIEDAREDEMIKRGVIKKPRDRD